ncbi:hypothetical protein K443DRAFT_98212, partial [Laccaria amethystina LaAM-08-1]
IFGNAHRPCKHYSTTTVYIMSLLFFPFFPDFLAIFAWINIFGNVHRPCKHYSKIVQYFSFPH